MGCEEVANRLEMITDNQNNEGSWERKHVQRVVDYHNNKHEAHIVIIGKTQDTYPNLKGKSDWDWVCRDTETNEKIAVEVKNFTDELLEVRRDIIWDILEEIKGDLSDKLPGTFVLHISIPSNFYLPLKGQRKQKLKDVLREAILQTAQTLQSGQDITLIPQISERLPFALPDSFSCALGRSSEEGSALYGSSGMPGVWSLRLNERELRKFEQLVSHANEQLEKANAKETFLIIIDEGLRITDHDTIPEAFKSISHSSYSHINHAYCMTGERVTEIPLPAS